MKKRFFQADDGALLAEVSDGRRQVVCVIYRERTLILRTPYEGGVLEIDSELEYSGAEGGRERVSFRLSGLHLEPKLYAKWRPKAPAILVPEARKAAAAAVAFYLSVDSPTSEIIGVEEARFDSRR